MSTGDDTCLAGVSCRVDIIYVKCLVQNLNGKKKKGICMAIASSLMLLNCGVGEDS